MKVFAPINLLLETKEGEKFKFFRNIFNGPETTIAITKDKRLIGWGKNENNLLGLTGEDSKMPLIFPPRIIETFPAVDEIKQISIGYRHTLILLQNSTVMGVGSNIHGELGRNDIQATDSIIEIEFPPIEADCIRRKNCSIEMIAAE